VREEIRKATDPLHRRLVDLESGGYQGVHEHGRKYGRGQFVTYRNSMWHCNRSTTQRPGDGPDWTLAVRAGRDGKDGRS
jgi:hypothetical protein